MVQTLARSLVFETMGKLKNPANSPERKRPARFAGLTNLENPKTTAFLFAGLIALQGVGYLTLGTGPPGKSVSLVIAVFENVLALSCSWIALRRARGTAAFFWLLFTINLVFLMVPTVLMTVGSIFNVTLVPDSTWRVLFCLYGVPVVMMLFLPETDQPDRGWLQLFLDQFQVAIVVGLAYSTFFYLPIHRLLSPDALLRNLIVSNLQSIFLLVAILVRLQFARTPSSRALFRRLGFFILACGTVTLVGNWIDLRHYSVLSAWFDLGWALPYVAAGFVALTWTPGPDFPQPSERNSFRSIVGANLVLVALLFCLILMLDSWKRAHGALLTNAAIAASLIALTFRLALTQFRQQQEIGHRKSAQEELCIANGTIAGLLEDARMETSAITQISELGALLQSCASRDEAFRVLPERMILLFPGTSGGMSVLNATRDRAELVAAWGLCPLLALPRGPEQSRSASRTSGCVPNIGSSFFPGLVPPEDSSLSIPLIARDEAIGVLVIRDDDQSSASHRSLHGNEWVRRQQLASALAEHIALTISNLDLREALQAQAIRDPLTGLYNRRYMQESLERELNRARRRDRPLSVVMLDIDHFKSHNDSYGHAAGDEVLRLVAETLTNCVRTEDLACRYGGEEFVLILPECGLRQAAIRADEVRQHLRALYDGRPGELPRIVTVSIGVAGFPETTANIDLLLQFADEALYRAKHEGRDRVVLARPELTDPHRSSTPSHRAAPADVGSESPTRS
jgi:diguanylate cyclase (GGDEF)-like protein